MIRLRRALVATFALALAPLAASCTGKYVRPTTNEKVPASPELVERGSYLVNSVALCGACHTPRVGGSWLGGERTDAYLAGGMVEEQPAFGFKISMPNVSQDRETGIGAWSDDEIMRAIRDGVHRDGRLLMPPMPFGSYAVMSDEDVRAIVAFLRTTPPVKNAVKPVRELPFMMRTVAKFGVMHHEPVKNVKAPDRSDKKAYGAYLGKIGACWDCHSMTSRGPSDKNLYAGSTEPFGDHEMGKIYARNLTPDVETGLGRYSAEQIKDALRSGKRLDGKTMAPPMSMLIPHVSTWTDEDLDALVTYLKALPAKKHAVPERVLAAPAKRLVGE
jgi:mono/diheme cytochrome c family protein